MNDLVEYERAGAHKKIILYRVIIDTSHFLIMGCSDEKYEKLRALIKNIYNSSVKI